MAYVKTQIPLNISLFADTEYIDIIWSYSWDDLYHKFKYFSQNGNLAQFQGIMLNRSLTENEQLDLTTTNSVMPDSGLAEFIESI